MAIAILIVSLTVFFLAAMLALLLVAKRLPEPAALPVGMWLATVGVVAISVTLRRAEQAVRREQQPVFRQWLLAAVLSSVLFFAAQSWGLWELVSIHLAAAGNTQTWILLFVLVGLHSLHVLVGLGVLGLVSVRALRGRFDHEYHLELTLVSRYWHFLDLMWLGVLATSLWLLR